MAWECNCGLEFGTARKLNAHLKSNPTHEREVEYKIRRIIDNADPYVENKAKGTFTAFKDRYGWEVDVVRRASYFTVTRWNGKARLDRPASTVLYKFPTLSEAIAKRKELLGTTEEGKGLMIYAVTAFDESTMLAEKDWPKYLKLRGEE